MVLYRDRRHAGRVLAQALAPKYGGRDDVVVLALPRGGVPVAWEVAQEYFAADKILKKLLGEAGL